MTMFDRVLRKISGKQDDQALKREDMSAADPKKSSIPDIQVHGDPNPKRPDDLQDDEEKSSRSRRLSLAPSTDSKGERRSSSTRRSSVVEPVTIADPPLNAHVRATSLSVPRPHPTTAEIQMESLPYTDWRSSRA